MFSADSFQVLYFTLELNSVLRAVDQNGADGVEVVVVATAEWAGPRLSYLKGK